MNRQIKDTLKPLKIPISYQTYIGREDPYITFFKMIEVGDQYADDEEISAKQTYQIDLFGKGDINNLEKDIKSLMLKSGWTCQGIWDMPFEKDTKLFHKAFRFYKGGM